MNRKLARLATGLLALPVSFLLTATPALAEWVDASGAPTSKEFASGWREADGTLARSKEFLDPSDGSWYWAESDGTIARGKDVWVPSNGGKWVRYGDNGRMVKGEDFRYGGWYYFDEQTGAMAKGVRWVASSGGKWVYYDVATGQMAHGEAYLSYDAEHTGWYYFDPQTGAMVHGDVWVPSDGGKWVRYDDATGQMVKGLDYRYGAWYYLDPQSGTMAHGDCWVPEWGGWYRFDQMTGRFVGSSGGTSVSQQSALRKANNYLSFTSFSRIGLIHQLEFEGFSTADSTWAADNCGANWYEQAEKKAKSYLSFMSFSRSGLIEQLEFEGFTHDQAVHGVNSVGL